MSDPSIVFICPTCSVFSTGLTLDVCFSFKGEDLNLIFFF